DGRGVAPLAVLVRTGDEEERLRACRALGRIGKPAVVPILREALADERWTVRAQAARALGGSTARDCIPDLELALADGAWWVRANAAETLRTAGTAGVAALERALRGDDLQAAERAREALGLVDAAAGRDG